MEEQAQLTRHSTETVLIPVNTFWHRACVCRACQLIGLFVLLAFGGTALYVACPPVGAAALAMGPSFIIMWIFYKRFQCSTTKLQAWYTFLEAIAWMQGLLIMIEVVDRWNGSFSGKDVVLDCEMSAEKGGKAFVQGLSFAAHCFRVQTDWLDTGDPPDGEWDGLKCTHLPMGLEDQILAFPTVDKGKKTGPNRLDAMPALLVMHIADDAAEDTNGTTCSAIENNVGDALGPVLVKSMAFGGKTVDTKTRSGLRSAFDDLFGRHVEGQDLCRCKKTLREIDGRVPAYDFCDEAGRCNVSYATGSACVVIGGEGKCADLDESGSVTATLSFRKKTVLYAFIEAYFRAAFFEELLKYVTVRRILFKDRVVDCGGLIVYGLAAAAGFATAENIQYTLMHGVFVTYARMLLAIPLHCCTGMMIGIHLGYRKFLGEGHMCLDKCILALAMPVLLHGTYDFILMLPANLGMRQDVRMLLALAVLVSGFIACRCMWLRIDNVCVVHVKDLQREGRVSKSTCCCWESDCCRVWCEQEDPVLKEKFQQRVPQAPAADSPSSDEDARPRGSMIFRLSKSLSSTLLPDVPLCQTREDTCPECRNTVRVHVLYPSDCPFCGHTFPDPAP